MISYEDFSKLEIKIGTIKKADVVEDADRLLRLEVDFGEESGLRQVVSGIREYFPDLDFLVDKQCPFVTNLEVREIRGLESQAMILAGSTNELFALLLPHQDLPPGTRVI